MLAFVTSLRHPLNSDDYGRVERLLGNTLRSVTSQTSDDYVVIVVGNVRPGFPLPRKVHFVPVDFPPPLDSKGPQTGREAVIWDKGTKLGVGLLKAREFDADWVMIFDADDFVHRGLTAFVHAHPGAPGFVVSEGWMYSASRDEIREVDEFNRTCGTSFLLPYEAYEVPANLGVGATQQQLADGFGERLFRVMGAHRDAIDWYTAHGRELIPVPFRAAIYRVETGENHSGKRMFGRARPVPRSVSRDFGLPPRPRPSLRQVAGSTAGRLRRIRPRLRRLAGAAVRRLRRIAPG